MPRPKASAARLQLIQQHVAAWKASGLSRREYSQLHHLRQSTFSRWCRVLLAGASRENLSTSFLEAPPGPQVDLDEKERVEFVQVRPSVITRSTRDRNGGGRLVLVVDRRFRVLLPQNFSSTALRKVVRVLTGLP